MSTFIAGFVPIIVMWALPLAPMIYAAIASTFESLSSPARREGREQATAAELAT